MQRFGIEALMKEKKNLRDREVANNREVHQLQAAIADQDRSELLGKRKRKGRMFLTICNHLNVISIPGSLLCLILYLSIY